MLSMPFSLIWCYLMRFWSQLSSTNVFFFEGPHTFFKVYTMSFYSLLKRFRTYIYRGVKHKLHSFYYYRNLARIYTYPPERVRFSRGRSAFYYDFWFYLLIFSHVHLRILNRFFFFSLISFRQRPLFNLVAMPHHSKHSSAHKNASKSSLPPNVSKPFPCCGYQIHQDCILSCFWYASGKMRLLFPLLN